MPKKKNENYIKKDWGCSLSGSTIKKQVALKIQTDFSLNKINKHLLRE
jgi:hypothetical protein